MESSFIQDATQKVSILYFQQTNPIQLQENKFEKIKPIIPVVNKNPETTHPFYHHSNEMNLSYEQQI